MPKMRFGFWSTVIILIALLLSSCGTSTGTGSTPNYTWEVKFYTNGSQENYNWGFGDTIETADTVSVIRSNTPGGKIDTTITIKADSTGLTVWNRSYNVPCKIDGLTIRCKMNIPNEEIVEVSAISLAGQPAIPQPIPELPPFPNGKWADLRFSYGNHIFVFERMSVTDDDGNWDNEKEVKTINLRDFNTGALLHSGNLPTNINVDPSVLIYIEAYDEYGNLLCESRGFAGENFPNAQYPGGGSKMYCENRLDF